MKLPSSRSVFDKSKLENDKKELENEQAGDGFYLDQDRVLEVGKKIKSIDNKLALIKKLENLFADCNAYVEFVEMGEEGLDEEVENSLHILESEVDDARIQTLLTGKYDSNDAIITLHAGAGGTEAQDWADMLYRMYRMYAEKNGYQMKVLDVIPGDEAGLKGVTFEINGDNAYGFLKAEKGIHRLVRISPFDSNARRHTSFASVEVMPKLDKKPDIEIKPEDLKIDTYRSSGAGGQNVNKTESAVRITHIPTGIIVACQVERSQVQNKETCMQMLYSKLVEKEEAEEMEKLASIRGEIKKIEWGSQIRSYVFCPYTLVKDHRTGWENSNIQAVMDGNIQPFINEYLKKI